MVHRGMRLAPRKCTKIIHQVMPMNHKQHTFAGALAGAGVYLLHQKRIGHQPTLRGAALAAIEGAIGGMLPDDLEPPDNPNHRGPFHSIATGIAVAKNGQRIFASEGMPQYLKEGLGSVCAGYVSHLLLDATTPKGLPLLRR